MRGEREREEDSRGGFPRMYGYVRFGASSRRCFFVRLSFFLSTGRLFLAGDVRDAIKFSPHIIRGSIVKFCEKKERGEAGKRERERRREGHGL